MAREPLRSDGALVLDDTGGGVPMGDQFEAQTNLRPIRITTTAGEEASYVGKNRWRVPKAILVATVDGLLSTGARWGHPFADCGIASPLVAKSQGPPRSLVSRSRIIA
jgi:hypothetical protein